MSFVTMRTGYTAEASRSSFNSQTLSFMGACLTQLTKPTREWTRQASKTHRFHYLAMESPAMTVSMI